MGVNYRTVGAVAVSTLLALLGLMWFQRRKRNKPGEWEEPRTPAAKRLDFSEVEPKVSQAEAPLVESLVHLPSQSMMNESLDCGRSPLDGSGDRNVDKLESLGDTKVPVTEDNCVAQVADEVMATGVVSCESTPQNFSSAGCVEELIEPVQEHSVSKVSSFTLSKPQNNLSEQPEQIQEESANLSFTANAETDIHNEAKQPEKSRQIKVVSASSLRSPQKPVSAETLQMSWAALADNENNENCTEEVSRLNDEPEGGAIPPLGIATNGHVVQTSPMAASPADDMVSSTSSQSDHSEVSCDSGKGVSIGHIDDPNDTSVVDGEVHDVDPIVVREFEFPSDLCGLLIGKGGRNIKDMKTKSGANISLSALSYTQTYQRCTVRGSQSAVDKAYGMLENRFGEDIDTSRKPKGTNQMMIPNETMQLTLPEGVSVDVIVSSIVSGGHIFVQQMTHPTFPSLERLNQCMVDCYAQMADVIVPQLPRPIEVGVICAAPMMEGWYRVQVVNSVDDADECDIRYVDYGGYSRVPASQLRQIRSDFMSLPFQAVEGYLANVVPLQGETEFGLESAAILEELTQGFVLKCQISGYAEDGIPYLQLYNVVGGKTTIVNRELVNRGSMRWSEEQ